jgi:hypothetical protein
MLIKLQLYRPYIAKKNMYIMPTMIKKMSNAMSIQRIFSD